MNNPFTHAAFIVLAMFVCVPAGPVSAADTIPLAGTWRFALDGEDVGVAERWFTKKLEDAVRLPGTTDENRKGIHKEERRDDRLCRPWYWKGPAWYQRDVTIPESWEGQRITLLLERSKNTRVWVDETFCGWEDTLSAYQVFDLTDALTPGKHTITVLVDNAKLPPVGPSHAVDERTQTNWNGIIGRLELRATDPVWLEDVQVYPDAAAKKAKVRVVIGNITGKPATGQLKVTCESFNVANPQEFLAQAMPIRAAASETTVEFTYQSGDNLPLWDEFEPAMLRLYLALKTTGEERSYEDKRSVEFGLRDFEAFRNQFWINGRRAFLRGRIDCCFYPLTGYPPMDKAGWRRVFAILKEWGLNHVRFHSWCPPKAAFEAADELGFYLQPEFPNKRSGFNAPEDEDAAIHNIDRLDIETTETEVSLFDYGKRESELIFRRFGNHPSFALYTLGNEMGRNQGMFDLVAHFQKIDPRHLYAQGSNNMHWNPSYAEGDDFWVGKSVWDATGKPLPLRAAFYYNAKDKGHIDNQPPSTMVDYSEAISGLEVPYIIHENAEFTVYPDYREIPKFTGVTRPCNYEIFRDRLQEAGMLDQARDFQQASGALAAICKREDIEAALRTPNLGGFQLLDIQDFGGQGTALVGLLDLFMDSKGIMEPQQRREYCCETVPLLRMKKYGWTTAETFVGRVQVAHYGAADIPAANVTWTITDSRGADLARGQLERTTIKQGAVAEIDMFAFPLTDVAAPQKLTVTLAIGGTPYHNDYPLWVYPTQVDTTPPRDITVARSLADPQAQQRLADGGTVLLLPPLDKLPHSVKGIFSTDFWSPMFAASAKRRGQELPPGTMGILCDPQHPAFAQFPTEFHSNWQWWHLVTNSCPIILDDTPKDYRPTLQVIDNYARNHKLGLIFETRVGEGKLLVCGVDLLGQQDQPAARQLLYSLLQYADSAAFAPKVELAPGLLQRLLP